MAEVLVNELITVLNDNEDTELVKLATMGSFADKWNGKLMSKNEQIKEAIQALVETYEEEKEKIKVLSFTNETKELESLDEEKGAAERHQKELQEEVDALKGEVEEHKKEADQNQHKYNKVKEDTAEELPRLRYEASLYSHISNIRWQYDADPEDVKGYICNKNGVQPFQMNTKQNSSFFIANYLWDAMDKI